MQGFARTFSEQIALKSRTMPHGFAKGLHFLPYQPAIFQAQAIQTLNQSGVVVLLQSDIDSVTVTDSTINEIIVLSSNKKTHIQADTFVDCSGESIVSTLAGLETRRQQSHQAAAFVFEVQGLPLIDAYPLALHLIRWIKKGIYAEILDADCDRLSLVPGTTRHQSALMKLGLPVLSNLKADQRNEYDYLARSRAICIVNYLRQADDSWALLEITSMATQVGFRSGLKPVGLEVLESEHILASRKPDNGIAMGAWPMEYWGQGRSPEMTYFGINDHYQIPAGALVSRQLDNLFFAGRAFSATEQAMASARVIGTCLGTGYAAGMLAAYQAQSGDWQNAIEPIRCKQVLKECRDGLCL